MKVFTKIALLLSVFLLFATPVYADVPQFSKQPIIQPLFTNINIFAVDFNITSYGKATIDALLSARDVTSVKIVALLQKYENGTWSTIDSWIRNVDDDSCLLGGQTFVSSGYAYRAAVYAYVYVNGSLVESDSIITNLKWY